MEVLRGSTFDATARPAVLTLMKLVANILTKPGEAKVRISNMLLFE
jgi:hypothetical protein